MLCKVKGKVRKEMQGYARAKRGEKVVRLINAGE